MSGQFVIEGDMNETDYLKEIKRLETELKKVKDSYSWYIDIRHVIPFFIGVRIVSELVSFTLGIG